MDARRAGQDWAAPRVVVCAWCAPQGRARVGVRPMGARAWYDGSPAFAHALKRARLASHGLCPACRPAVAAEWGIVDDAGAPPARTA